MCRVYNIGGFALAVVTQLLILFGQWSGNRLVLFYWFYEEDMSKHMIKGLPLTQYGMINFLFFNGFCAMSIITHIRASIADPGSIPTNIEVPDYVDTAQLNCCEKCQMRWKQQRAHHCSECGICIFKVRFKFDFTNLFFVYLDGPSLPLDKQLCGPEEL